MKGSDHWTGQIEALGGPRGGILLAAETQYLGFMTKYAHFPFFPCLLSLTQSSPLSPIPCHTLTDRYLCGEDDSLPELLLLPLDLPLSTALGLSCYHKRLMYLRRGYHGKGARSQLLCLSEEASNRKTETSSCIPYMSTSTYKVIYQPLTSRISCLVYVDIHLYISPSPLAYLSKTTYGIYIHQTERV